MDVSQLVASLKVPKVFREIITLIGGIGFLLIIWILKLKNLNIDFGLVFTRPEIDFIFLIVAYLSGKLILSITSIFAWVDDFINYLFCVEKKNNYPNYFVKIKNFLGYKHVKSISYDDVKNLITTGEVWKELSKHELFEESLERDRQSLIFSEFFIFYAILFCLFLKTFKIVSIFFLLFFLVTWYGKRRNLSSKWIDFQKHIVKGRYSQPTEKEPIR